MTRKICAIALTVGIMATGATLPSYATVAKPPPTTEAPPPPKSSHWTWPIAQPVHLIKKFDNPTEKWLAGHRGIDLAATPGQIVTAPADGTITFSGVVVDRHLVVIDHGGLRTTLEPVEGAVPVGTRVTSGDPIGIVTGEEPDHCGPNPCVHWGIRRADEYINPLRMLYPHAVLRK